MLQELLRVRQDEVAVHLHKLEALRAQFTRVVEGAGDIYTTTEEELTQIKQSIIEMETGLRRVDQKVWAGKAADLGERLVALKNGMNVANQDLKKERSANP